MSKVQGFVQTKRRTGSSFAAHTLIKIAWIQARVGSHSSGEATEESGLVLVTLPALRCLRSRRDSGQRSLLL
jgi:hypothetical protein